MDLLDYFRRRRPWPQLLRFLARLPVHGHYKAAIADDDANAALMAAMPASPSTVPLAGYSAVVSRLDTLIDVLVAANSAGGRTPPRMPRPTTALERYRAREARSRHRTRVAMLLPGSAGTA